MKNIGKFFGTQKQWFCAIVLALVCAGMAFSQQSQPAPEAEAEARPARGPAKNAIAVMDLMPLFKGFLASDSDYDVLFVCFSFGYERLLVPHISLGGNVDLYFGKVGEESDGDNIPYLYFSIAAAGRYYPMSEQMEKFFVGAIFGFNVQAVDGKTKAEYGGFGGPLIGVNFGYKAMLGKMFFVEPSMSYIYAKQNYGPTPLGWQGGIRLGLAL